MINLESKNELGLKMHQWAHTLFPICRSILGPGVRETLSFLQHQIPDLEVRRVKTGTQVFDWTIPKEWHVKEAYIADLDGNKVIDFVNSNLHLVGYSTAVNLTISRDNLLPHIYSLPNLPNAIPYVTSYYKESWGFCVSEQQRKEFVKNEYKVVIDTEFVDGELNYGELLIKGESDKEVLISTYICHPSMANNELSGPVVTTALAQLINDLKNRYYSYRVVFVPETIGSISFIHANIKKLKEHVVAGFVLTCIGDERAYSYLSSRSENTLSDRVAKHVLFHHTQNNYKSYSFLDRGSDERQYCAPGVDLPICSIMRTKYGEYPEYHTSLDDLNLVTPDGLAGGLEVAYKSILLLEHNKYYKVSVYCEPQLGKRGLYPTLSKMDEDYADVRTLINFIAYCDGKRDLISIAEKVGVDALSLIPTIQRLLKEGLLLMDNKEF